MSERSLFDLVSQYQVGIEQLVYLVCERTTERHTRTEKAPGENRLLTHNSASVKREECRLTGNIRTQTLTALTRHDFHNWADP